MRHATSKIRKVEDLVTISSLGFRGEALSSIAAVAQVELITKTPEQFTGSRYLIEGGKEISLEEIGAPNGTTFLVKNLFYNTPVRRKFLKSNQTEAGYVNDLMERIALYQQRADSSAYFRKRTVKGYYLSYLWQRYRCQSAGSAGRLSGIFRRRLYRKTDHCQRKPEF